MKGRTLSRREHELFQQAVEQLCQTMGVSANDPDMSQAAWAALLTAYRSDPQSFVGLHAPGWTRGYQLAQEEILVERRARTLFLSEYPTGCAASGRYRGYPASAAPFTRR